MCVPIIVIPQKTKNKGATFDKKKWHKVAPYDNNNNNRYETTILPCSHPSSQFTLFAGHYHRLCWYLRYHVFSPRQSSNIKYLSLQSKVIATKAINKAKLRY